MGLRTARVSSIPVAAEGTRPHSHLHLLQRVLQHPSLSDTSSTAHPPHPAVFFVLSEAAPAPATMKSSHQVRSAFCSHHKPSQIPGLPTTSPSTPVSPIHGLHLCPLPQVLCWSLCGPITAPGWHTGFAHQSKDRASLCLPQCHYFEVLSSGSKTSALRILSLSLGLVWLCSGSKGHPWPHGDAH